MTAQEAKDRTELNMDDAKLAETQAKVAEILHAEPKQRKPRSDKGVPKPKKEGNDFGEVVLHLSLHDARHLTYACAATERLRLGGEIQDQIIAQLQKRLDSLAKH